MDTSYHSIRTPHPPHTQSRVVVSPIIPASHRLDVYQVERAKIPLGNIFTTRDNHIQVAQACSERLSVEDYRDPSNAWAEILSPTVSPTKTIIGNRDSAVEQWVRSMEVTRTGHLNLRILSDAFFYKCGFRDSRDITIGNKEGTDWKKKSQPNGSRSKCVLSMSDQLESEAGLTEVDLKEIVQAKAFRGTINGPGGTNYSTNSSMSRDDQNAAAHEQAVGVLAHHLTRYFRANPDEDAKRRTEAMLRWVTGSGMELACTQNDARILTREVVLPPLSHHFSHADLDEEELEYLNSR